MEEKKSIKRIIINTIILVAILLIGIFLYAKYVETKRLDVREYKVENSLIPESFNGDKIIYFTDLLYGSTFFKKDLEKLVEKINEYKPDIVIFGGDLLSKGYKIKEKEKKELIKVLSKIDASLGKYSTTSDSDKEVSSKILSESGFIVETNKDYLIYDKSNTPICISLVDSYNSNKYNLEEVLKQVDTFTIMVSHEPDLVKELNKENMPQIILSGNALGGEINIPFIGTLKKFKGSTKYYKEEYTLDKTKLYISNGLGTKKTFLRLFNRPSFTVLRLKNKN